MRRARDEAGRQSLPHDVPSWIRFERETYFVTICTRPRGQNQLCHERMAAALFEAARYRQEVGDWFVHLMLLMPDHLHALLTFPNEARACETVVRSWKRLTARKLGVRWQRDFFEHRIRQDSSDLEKAEYILENPVRAGLAKGTSEWAYVMFGEGE